MLYSAIGITILLSLINQYHSADIPSVQTKLGTITGVTKEVTFLNNKYQIDRYLGIPYAKPPMGDLRFQEPEPFGQFSETYNADEFGASCPQPTYITNMPAEKKIDEDCLFLNVYVPRQKSDDPSGHAVMLFIHGGGFRTGSGTHYNGSVLSVVGNVIVVTINYRLGLLGFLDLDNEMASGNFALFDQRLALKWVNENIGAFGGDKDRVTIFGQSAGSTSVGIQMMYPSNNGLFRGGITESGALGVTNMYFENNIEISKYFAKRLNCNVETIDLVFNCLRQAPFESIIKAIEEASPTDLESVTDVNIVPTIDGKFIRNRLDGLLKKAQTETSEEIEFFRSLKLINGVTGSEGALFIMIFGDAATLENFEVTREQMNTQQIPMAITMGLGKKQVSEVVKQLIISEYTDWKNPDDPKRLREKVIDLLGDIFYNAPAIEMSRVHSYASNGDSYVYTFLPKVDKPLVQTTSWVKYAGHGDELGPIFGYALGLGDAGNITEYTPPEWELDLSKRMIKYWTNFAKSG